MEGECWFARTPAGARVRAVMSGRKNEALYGVAVFDPGLAYSMLVDVRA